METEESKRVAEKWNEFMIETQTSQNPQVYVVNYVVVVLDQLAKQNNKSFKEMLQTLEVVHGKGLWKDFVK